MKTSASASEAVTGNQPTVEQGPSAVDARAETGRYDFLEEIARGGMGVIVRGWDNQLRRELAFKVLHAHLNTSAPAVRRFHDEACILGQLQHPGVVPVHEVGTLLDGRPYFAMKLVRGRTMSELLRQRAPGDVPRLLKIFEQICQTLAYAHAHQVIHRDLKPSNIMVGTFGEVQVMDWGLAKVLSSEGTAQPEAVEDDPLATITEMVSDATGADDTHTRAGSVLGTLAYMPPEQARGQIIQIDQRSDVFGLGSLLCEILTGAPTYPTKNREELRVQAMVADPAPVQARLRQACPDGDLLALALRCLAPAPGDRFAHAGDVAQAMAHYLSAAEARAHQAEVERARAETQAREERKRRRVQMALVVCLLGVAVGAIGTAALIDDARRNEADSAAAANAALAKEAEARAAESSARQQAQEANTRALQRLTRLHIATGSQAEERGEPFTALQWYARAWQDDVDSANEPAHRLRLGAVLLGSPRLAGVCFHGRSVDDEEIDASGTRLVTRTTDRRGQRGNSAFIWDFSAGKLSAPPLRHDGPVRFAGFSPDGSRVLTASEDGTAGLWDAAGGQRLHSLRHGAPVVAAAFAPDGKTAFCAAGTQVLRWDVATGQRAGAAIECPGNVWAFQMSRDGGRLVTADATGKARVWETSSGKPAGPSLPHLLPSADESRFYKMGPALSPDGSSVLVVAGHLNVQACESMTGKVLWEVPARGYFLLWSADGRRALVEQDTAQKVLDARTGQVLLQFDHARLASYGALSPDGKWLFTGISGGGIYTWDLATGKPRGQPLKCGDFLRRLRPSADGRWLTACSQDGTARVWDLQASSTITPYDNDCGRAHYPAHSDGSSRSPDARSSFRPGREGGVLVRPGSVDLPLPHPAQAMASQFSADGSRLATFAGNAIRVWDTTSGEPVGPPLELDSPAGLVPRLELAGDGSRVAGIFVQQKRSVAAIVWEASGRRLFTLPHKIESGQQIFGESNLDGLATGARLSPDGRLIAAAVDSSGELSIFETGTGLRRFRARVYRGYVYQMEFDSSGHSLFATASDNQARELDTATGKPISPSLHHPTFPRQMGISPDGRRMATVSEDGRLRVWDVGTGDLLLNANVRASLDDFNFIVRGQRRCWFSHDGKTVQYFSSPNYWRLRLPAYAGPADAVARAARLLTGRYLDETNGLADLASDEFIDNREAYRKAWLAWQGLPDDPAAQP